MRVHYEILNQKGTPAFYSDTYTNRPTYGFAGRVFISTDTGQIFEDTGSAWSLIADAGVGGGTLGSVCANGNSTSAGIIITAGGLSSNSITNTSLTTGSIIFADGGGLQSQNNTKLYWDNTNFRLGIGNNSPGAPLDIHSTGTNAQFNGTGTNNAYLVFQNAGTSKWRIGNTYSAGANTFDIYNNTLSAKAISINSTDNTTIFTYDLNTKSTLTTDGGIKLNITATIEPPAGYNAICGITNGILIVTNLAAGGGFLNFPSTSTPTYTFPNATGTLALTSNLSSYLPLTGGTLTGQLYINPTNTGTIGLDVASDNVRFRSDNLEGNKRQLLITMGSGTLVQLTAQGYGANYGTDLGFYTATTGGVNSLPGIYITSANNVGIGTGTPNGTYGKLTVAGGITIADDNNAKLEIGRYSSGVANSYIKIGTNSSSLKISNSTDSADLVSFLNTGFVFFGALPSVLTYMKYNFNVGTDKNIGFKINSNYASLEATNDGVSANIPIQLVGTSYILNGLGTGSVTSTSGVLSSVSDMNLKIEAGYIDNALDKVLKLKPRYFYWKEDLNLPTDIKQLGFYAQEVNQALGEEVANSPKTEKDKWGIYDRGIIAMLTKAIQELNEKLVRNNIN